MSHLGDVRSLVLHPGTTSHAHLSAPERDRLGIDPGLMRLSVGIEDEADLLADLEQAFRAVRAAAAASARVGGVTPDGAFPVPALDADLPLSA
jgi:O-acetylhomoserine (thiol)-lyase